MAQGKLKISELARRSGVSPRTIRFYETAGVFPAPPRAPNGYRLYTAEAAEILRFIQRAQGLGLTLAEIREMVTIRRKGRAPCDHVRDLAERRLEAIAQALRELAAQRRMLRDLLTSWPARAGGAAAICPHIESGDRTPNRRRRR